MGKPGISHVMSPAPEFIGCVEGTRGSETSQYPQEEKTTVIPQVVASERGPSLNRWRARPVRGCVIGVDESHPGVLTRTQEVIKLAVSETVWESRP